MFRSESDSQVAPIEIHAAAAPNVAAMAVESELVSVIAVDIVLLLHDSAAAFRTPPREETRRADMVAAGMAVGAIEARRGVRAHDCERPWDWRKRAR